MAIIHDAYLFQPADFAREVLPCARAMAVQQDGEGVLIEAVIDRFENSDEIRRLAMWYGGWPPSSLYEEKDKFEHRGNAGSEQVDVGWLIALMIYGHLHPVPTTLGLGDHHSYDLLDYVLLSYFHWHPSDRSILIHGHSFGYFAQCWIAPELDIVDAEGKSISHLDYWESVGTRSTVSTIGWLDYSDVCRLLEKLRTMQAAVNDMKTSLDIDSIRKVYYDAVKMLRAASDAQCGLCFISSG